MMTCSAQSTDYMPCMFIIPHTLCNAGRLEWWKWKIEWRNQTIVETKMKQTKSNEATIFKVSTIATAMAHELWCKSQLALCFFFLLFFAQLYTRFNNSFAALYIKSFELMLVLRSNWNDRKTNRFGWISNYQQSATNATCKKRNSSIENCS